MAATSSVDRDERLAQLLADIDELRQRGTGPDWDKITSEHPDLVDELRQLVAVGQVVDLVTLVQPTPDAVAQARKAASSWSGPRTLGDYDLVQELGRGGMGVVYKAWDRNLRRYVALKTVLKGEQASDEELGRFRREAQAAAGLEHPHIVPVYRVGEENGQAYFCMKFVEGRNLAELIKQGPLPPRQAARYLAQVAHAIQHAHENGILHRDLKPANILLDADDHALVSDFGLAKLVEGGATLTGTGAILGTPSYMAPEQTSAQGTTTPASDIYSLGAILYEMLTGRPPFLAATPLEILLLVRSEEPVRPRLLNPGIDLDLELICRKCLEKRPEHRYDSAAALAHDLEAFLRDEPVSARSSSLVYFVSKLFRDTHHAPVLENWGLLWILHSFNLLLLCGVTSLMYALGVRGHFPFLALWSTGLIVWGAIFWNLRRRLGPVTFVERQIAHLWASGVVAAIATFWIEVILDRPVLELTSILSVTGGMIFLGKAGTLSGWFYIAAGLSFVAALPMAWLGPPWSPLLFGLVSAIGFLVPGWKYYRQVTTGPE